MKKLLLILAAISLLGLDASSAVPPKYSGTWILNREKSEGLTGGLAGSEIILVVSQDSQKIHVEQKVRIRGREQPSQELIWNLDGSETTAEVVRPMAGTMNLKARWVESKKVLELDSSIKGEDQGKPISVSIKEVWQLINNGNSLRITRTRTSPQGAQSFILFFDKQR